MYVSVIVLKNFNLTIFLKRGTTSVYIYNTNYFCIFKFTKIFSIKLKGCSIFEISSRYVVGIRQDINVYLKQFYLNDFTKIKFTGKGYKIKKNSKSSIILLFNRAHTTTLWWNNITITKLKKYKFYIKYNCNNINLISKILEVRSLNIFTKKGLRQSRQIVLRKKGKK